MEKNKKQSLYFIFGSLLVVVLIVSLVFTNRKGTYSIGNGALSISLSCPAKVSIGDNIVCTVNLTNANSTILSINANYDLASTIDYVSFEDSETCTGNNCFSVFATTSNGFATINSTGVTSSVEVGKLTLRMSNNASPNTTYKVKLTNIEICDDEYEMYSFEDVEVNVQTKNNNATLTNIAATGTVKSQNFNGQNKEYTATVASNVSTISLTASKSDTNATVNGNLTNLNLHYGTNESTITVTAEDNTTTNTYNISIYREFEFTTNKYTYDAQNNYIYIKNDTISAMLGNLEQLPENLSYTINNNKLEIRYLNDEVLSSINIIGFTTTYSITDNGIFISNASTTLSQLKSNITCNGVVLKLFDQNDTAITSDSHVLVESDKVKIYYNTSGTLPLLETYNLTFEYLNIDNSLVIDTVDSIIKRLPIGTTLGDLKAKIQTSGTVTIKNVDSATNSYEVKTGDTLKIQLSSRSVEYTISIVGCLDDSPTVEMTDIIKVYRYMKGRITLTKEQIAAADIINDGEVNLRDVIRLYLYFKNKVDSLEGN